MAWKQESEYHIPRVFLKVRNKKLFCIQGRVVFSYLISEDIFASEVSESVFSLYRYYPDIPGNSLGWGTVKKYLSGNLIFKTNNEKQLYYYQFLHPWIHYIPVKDDFSDLEEKFNWSQKNIDETIKIAYRGYITIFDYLQNIDNYFINSLLKYRI